MPGYAAGSFNAVDIKRINECIFQLRVQKKIAYLTDRIVEWKMHPMRVTCSSTLEIWGIMICCRAVRVARVDNSLKYWRIYEYHARSSEWRIKCKIDHWSYGRIFCRCKKEAWAGSSQLACLLIWSEHCSCIAEIDGSNPLPAWVISGRLSFAVAPITAIILFIRSSIVLGVGRGKIRTISRYHLPALLLRIHDPLLAILVVMQDFQSIGWFPCVQVKYAIWLIECITSAFWAKRGERGILREARNEREAWDEGRKKNQVPEI